MATELGGLSAVQNRICKLLVTGPHELLVNGPHELECDDDHRAGSVVCCSD